MIDISSLFFSYSDSPPWLLHDLDLRVRPGDYISVLGDNGSGKSTLSRILLVYLEPSRGNVRVDTKDIGYVPQRRDVGDRDFPLTVYEALNTFRRLKKLSPDDLKSALQHVDLTGREAELIGSLSGGQQQKLLIARALMGDPPLIILDEPSTGIDPTSQKDIYELLSHMSKVHGTTIISVEHNIEAAMANSTRIYHLAGGSGHICTPAQYMAEHTP